MLLIKFITDLFNIPGEVHQNVMHAKISHFLLPAGGIVTASQLFCLIVLELGTWTHNLESSRT